MRVKQQGNTHSRCIRVWRVRIWRAHRDGRNGYRLQLKSLGLCCNRLAREVRDAVGKGLMIRYCQRVAVVGRGAV